MTSSITETGWDLERDVVVAGYGYAGAMAAIAAHDSGARVLLLEKARYPGGNSIVSAGGLILAEDAGKAFRYLQAINAGTTPDDVLWQMAQGMVELPAFLRAFAGEVGAEVEFGPVGQGATYPLPGGETLFFGKIGSRGELAGFPWIRGQRAGARLFRVVADHVSRRDIEVWYESPARRLITGLNGEVRGVLAEHDGRPLRIKARRGVVLATGGFENSPELCRQYYRALPIYPVCTLTNTGDGIIMAQKAGAALWHMWHFHGSYGFKFPEFPFAFRTCLRGSRSPRMAVPWIVVDQRGRRFMNEYPPAPQDTAARDLDTFDADAVTYPRIPSYLVFDDAARRLGPIADVTVNDPAYVYEWSADNSAEIARGWILQAATIAGLAERIGVSSTGLEGTVAAWNEACASGHDPDFGRLPTSMRSIAAPPFYTVPVYPLVTNTQGGPVHDVNQRVLDPFGEPIPRLYAAGELGSIYGSIYQLSGNITECFVGGRIAGRNAGAAVPWE